MTAPGMDPSPAEGARRQGAEESGVSRNHLRDLVALLALPALWKEKDQQRIAGGGPFTVAEFRDLVGASRKYAVPLLEYLDQAGFTRRQGDVRVLGPEA